MSIFPQVSFNLRNWLMLPGAWLPKQKDTVYTAPIRWAQTCWMCHQPLLQHTLGDKRQMFCQFLWMLLFLLASHTLCTSSVVAVSHHSISSLTEFCCGWIFITWKAKRRFFHFYVYTLNLVLNTCWAEWKTRSALYCRSFRIQIYMHTFALGAIQTENLDFI